MIIIHKQRLSCFSIHLSIMERYLILVEINHQQSNLRNEILDTLEHFVFLAYAKTSALIETFFMKIEDVFSNERNV